LLYLSSRSDAGLAFIHNDKRVVADIEVYANASVVNDVKIRILTIIMGIADVCCFTRNHDLLLESAMEAEVETVAEAYPEIDWTQGFCAEDLHVLNCCCCEHQLF
jgi:hypothetical protein